MTNESDSIETIAHELAAPVNAPPVTYGEAPVEAHDEVPVNAPVESPAQGDSAPWLVPHRWKPGQSGNPSGRPRESGSLSAALRRVGIKPARTRAELVKIAQQLGLNPDEAQNIDVVAGLMYDGITQLLIRTVKGSTTAGDKLVGLLQLLHKALDGDERRITLNGPGDVQGGGRVELAEGMVTGSQIHVNGNLAGTIEVAGESTTVGVIEIGTSSASSSITNTGRLTVAPPLALTNNVLVHGNMNGLVQLKSGLAQGSSANINGNQTGTIEIGVPTGGTVSGLVYIGGALSGTITHKGLVTSSGEIYIGSVSTGGKYIQSTEPTGSWAGTMTVNGNMAGTLTWGSKLQDASATVAGSMSGTINISGAMHNSSLDLNTVNYCNNSTSGTINVGVKQTVWTPNSGSSFVDLDGITIWGDFTSTARLKFIVYQWSSPNPITLLRTVNYKRHHYGQEQVLVPNGVTPPTILHSYPQQDPCCTSC